MPHHSDYSSYDLSPEQAAFALMLSNYPKFAGYWNWENRECDIELLREHLPSWSHGEQLMAKFFCAVWQGDNDIGFDLIAAASVLDDQHRQTICEWLAEPFFP